MVSTTKTTTITETEETLHKPSYGATEVELFSSNDGKPISILEVNSPNRYAQKRFLHAILRINFHIGKRGRPPCEKLAIQAKGKKRKLHTCPEANSSGC